MTKEYIKHDKQCEACEVGMMRPTGELRDYSPPQFVHSCTYCSKPRLFTVEYPVYENHV